MNAIKKVLHALNCAHTTYELPHAISNRNFSMRGLCFAVLAFLIIPNGFFNTYLKGEELPTGPTQRLTDPNTLDEAEIKPQYTDPKTLTGIHFKATEYYKDRGTKIKSENWIKDSNHWYCNDVGDWTIIKNGKDSLVLDQKNMTAKTVTTNNYPYIDYTYSRVINLIELGLSLISGKEPNRHCSDIYFARNGHKYKHATKKSTENTVVYYTNPTGYSLPGEIHIDAKTGLVQKMIQVRSLGQRIIEFSFDYSEIPLEKFSLDIPKGYKDITKRLPARFQGHIFDKDLNPVPNADIYILGSQIEFGTHGKSDSNGYFDLDAFIKSRRSKARPLPYPIFVHAVSKDHPGQVAWTLVLHPKSKTKLPAVVPSPGEVLAKGDGDAPKGNCAGISGVTLVLEPAITISGQILKTEDNKPVRNLSVRLSARGNYGAQFRGIQGAGHKEGIRRYVKTDANGYYSFESIPSFVWPQDSIDKALEIANRPTSNGLGTNFITIEIKTGSSGNAIKEKRITLWPGDILADKQFDISFSGFLLLPRHNVTVRGIAVNNYGEPIAGYGLRQYYERTESSRSSSLIKGAFTDENGEFELTKCVYNKALGIQVATGKPGDWGKSALTKGKEFVYYAPKTVPVGFEMGKFEYDIKIVLEKPELKYYFDVYDTSGRPIEGMAVNIGLRSIHTSEQWEWKLQAKTDSLGQCVIEDMPRISFIDFEVNRHLAEKPVNIDKELLQYISLTHEVRDLPFDEEGYLFQIIMPKKGEEFDSRQRVRYLTLKAKRLLGKQ